MENVGDDIIKLLGIQDLVVISIKLENDGRVVVLVCESTEEDVPCPHCECKQTKPRKKGNPKRVRHMDLWGKTCYLEFLHYTHRCPECGLCHLRPVSFLETEVHYTNTFVRYLVDLSQGCSLSHTSRTLGIPDKTVENIYYRYLLAKHKTISKWKAKHIGIDEIAMKKGHKNYLLIIYDLDKGIVLDVLPNRLKATLKEYIERLPKETKDAIESICIDMWKPYRQCLEEVFPRKMVIIDRFHVSKELGKAVDKVRKELNESGKLSALTGEERKKLYWAVRYSKKNLKKRPEYEKVLRKAMKVSPELKQVITLRREFKQIFNLKRFSVAKNYISNWLRKVSRTKLKPMLKFLKTFKNWRSWIVNFFKCRYSNGPAEGLNTKIKLIKRLGFGYRSVVQFRLRLLHTCGDLI